MTDTVLDVCSSSGTSTSSTNECTADTSSVVNSDQYFLATLYDQTDCTKASPYSQYYRAYYCFIVSGGSQQWIRSDLGEMVLESYSDDSCSVDSVLSEDVVVTLNACQAATSNATLYTFNTAPSLATNTLLSFVLVVSALLLLF